MHALIDGHPHPWTGGHSITSGLSFRIKVTSREEMMYSWIKRYFSGLNNLRDFDGAVVFCYDRVAVDSAGVCSLIVQCEFGIMIDNWI